MISNKNKYHSGHYTWMAMLVVFGFILGIITMNDPMVHCKQYRDATISYRGSTTEFKESLLYVQNEYYDDVIIMGRDEVGALYGEMTDKEIGTLLIEHAVPKLYKVEE